jgi:GntR family transcriptional regulator
MLIELDPLSDEPPYEQIRIQVRALIVTGTVEAGTRLPSIRQLAGDLGVATGTVARAYRELEADGVVRSRGARGTTVIDDAMGAELLAAAQDIASAAARSQLSVDDALLAVRIAFAARRTVT